MSGEAVLEKIPSPQKWRSPVAPHLTRDRKQSCWVVEKTAQKSEEGISSLPAALDRDSPQVHSVEPKTPRTRGREATGQAHSSSPGCPRAAGEGLVQPEEAEGSSWVLGTAWQGDEEQACWQWSRKRPSGNSHKPSM